MTRRAGELVGRGAPLLEAAALATALLLFAGLKSFGLAPAVGDEGIYFQSAALVLEGALPYRDFFFAHPPLHLAPAVVAFSLFGPSFAVAKLIPPVSAAVAGLGLWCAGRRAGRLAGVLAAVAWWFAHDVLRAASHYTGICETLALLAWGVAAFVWGRAALAGCLLGLAACTGVYAAPAAAALGALALASGRGEGGRFGIGFAGAWLVINAACLGLGGAAYVEQVYVYHLRKPALAGSPFALVLWHDFELFAGGALGLSAWLAWLRPARRPGEGRLPWLARALADPGSRATLVALAGGAAYLVFIALLRNVFHFYYLLLFAFLALLAGIGAAALVARAGDALRGRSGRAAPASLLLALLVLMALRPQLERFAPYYAGSAGRSRTYTWFPPPLPRWAARSIRWLWWRDERVVGKRYSQISFYLWHESRHFDAAFEIADYVAAHSGADETLFGDSTSAPLVALLAGRRIGADEVDTNGMRFLSGTTAPEEVLARLASRPPRFVLVKPGRGFATLEAFRDWIAREYAPERHFRDRHHGEYVLYGRRDPRSPRPPMPSDPV